MNCIDHHQSHGTNRQNQVDRQLKSFRWSHPKHPQSSVQEKCMSVLPSKWQRVTRNENVYYWPQTG